MLLSEINFGRLSEFRKLISKIGNIYIPKINLGSYLTNVFITVQKSFSRSYVFSNSAKVCFIIQKLISGMSKIYSRN